MRAPPHFSVTDMFSFKRGTRDAAAHRLGSNFLLAGLSAGELNIVEGFMHDRRYLAGEVVFDEGEDGQALYIIHSGQVAICHPGQGDHPIAVLGAGEFFGELALLDDSPRSAQARAMTDAEVAVLFRGDFERLMESHAHISTLIAMQLARYLGQRLRRMVTSGQAHTVGE